MLIRTDEKVTISLEVIGEVTHLRMPDDVARLIYDEMEKRYFRDDFTTFLHSPCNEFDICETDTSCTWSLLWDSYQKHKDMNVAIWDTFKDVSQDVWETCGYFVCCKCGKKLLSEFPKVDRDGYCYCDNCADELLDYCEICGECYLKSNLTYVEDGVGYCEHCKHADE